MHTQRLHRTDSDQRAIERTRPLGETQNLPHIHVLQDHEFFHGLPAPILRRISSRVRQAYYAAGRPIFSKGDPGHGLVAVLSGIVKISVVSQDGKEIALNLLGAGEIFVKSLSWTAALALPTPLPSKIANSSCSTDATYCLCLWRNRQSR
jgi:hypothetical protein